MDKVIQNLKSPSYLLALLILIGVLSLFFTPYYLYAIVLILVVLFLVFLSVRPDWGYLIILALVPFDAFRGLTGNYQFLTISKFVGLWLCLVVLFSLLLKKIEPIQLRSNLWTVFLIFTISFVFSTVMSDYIPVSMDNIRKLLSVFMFFFLSLAFIQKKHYVVLIPRVLLVAVSLSSALSILGFVFEIPLFTTGLDTEIETMKRGVGASKDPNFFSSMVIFIMPLLAYWFFESKKMLFRFGIFILFIINVIGLMLTLSRSGALVLIFILFLLFLEYSQRIKVKQVGVFLAGVGFLVVMVLLLTPESYRERMSSVVEVSTDHSLARRWSYLLVARDAIKDNPVFGSGPGTYPELYGRSGYAQFFLYQEDTLYRSAHNTYVEVVTGLGIVGLIIFLWLLWRAYHNFEIARHKFYLNKEIAMASLVKAYQTGYLSVMVYFMLLSSFYHKFFWLCLALSQISIYLAEEQSRS